MHDFLFAAATLVLLTVAVGLFGIGPRPGQFGDEAPAFADVAQGADEVVFAAHRVFADRQFERYRPPVLVTAEDFARGTDQVRLAGAQIAFQIAIMGAVMGLGHEQRDIAADHLVGRVAQGPFERRIGIAHDAPAVDRDHAVAEVLDDGADFLFLVVQRFERRDVIPLPDLELLVQAPEIDVFPVFGAMQFGQLRV